MGKGGDILTNECLTPRGRELRSPKGGKNRDIAPLDVLELPREGKKGGLWGRHPEAEVPVAVRGNAATQGELDKSGVKEPLGSEKKVYPREKGNKPKPRS